MILVFLSTNLYSQNNQESDVGYARNSISCFYLGFPGESMSGQIAKKVSGLSLSYYRYFDNNLNNKTLISPYNRKTIDASGAELIKNLLEKEGVAHKIVSQMYKRQADGSMSLDLIHERGRYNANDADVLQSKVVKRGESQLADFGDSLINRSYIMVVDFKDVTNARQYSSNAKGWSSNVKGYLFRIIFTPEIRKQIYDCWIYADDAAEVKERKRKAFDNIVFPITYVARYENNITEFVTGELARYYNDDDLLKTLVEQGFGRALGSFGVGYSDFQVKATIFKTNPIRSKIGRKEGVQLDDLYYVYEHIMDQSTGKVEEKLRGTIRATNKIGVNNHISDGNSPTTRFYQTYGRKLKPGYSLEYMGNFDGEIKIGYEIGNVGGMFVRADVRLSDFLKIRSSFAFIDCAFELKEEYIDLIDRASKVAFFRYGFGLSKGITLTRNIELRPYGGFGFENAFSSTFEGTELEGIRAIYLKGGADISINISLKMRLFGGLGYYSFIGNPVNKNMQEINQSWSQLFSGREGQTIQFGLIFGM